MERSKIRECISRAGDHYLEILGDAEHMERIDDGFSTTIRPKAGAQGGTSVFNLRFGGMSDDEIDLKIRQLKDSDLHVYWARLPQNVLPIFARHFPVLPGSDDDEEVNMAMFPEEKPEYLPPSPPVSVKRVETPQDFMTWADIANTVLHGGYPIMHRENHYHLCQTGAMRCYLGLYDLHPVATSAVLMNDGVASLEFVATLADHRRRGVGRAVCCAAIDDAFEARSSLVTLRAFRDGKELYLSLGFGIY